MQNATGLRIDDWADITIDAFIQTMDSFVATVKEYNNNLSNGNSNISVGSYKISIVDDDGNEHYKTFDKTELSANANLMFNDLESIINEEYGDSLSANEKRQVLFELIQNSFN